MKFCGRQGLFAIGLSLSLYRRNDVQILHSLCDDAESALRRSAAVGSKRHLCKGSTAEESDLASRLAADFNGRTRPPAGSE
jgi:hypothetical protein